MKKDFIVVGMPEKDVPDFMTEGNYEFVRMHVRVVCNKALVREKNSLFESGIGNWSIAKIP